MTIPHITQRNHHDNANFVIGSIVLALILIVMAWVAEKCHAGTISESVRLEHANGETLDENTSRMFLDNIPKERAVYACIGEAEGEPYIGKLAVMCAIRNRGTLKGVYGERSPRVKQRKYSSKTLVDAIRAWEESANVYNCTMIKKATGWGNARDIRLFKTTKWFKKCTVVANIKDHFFYRCDK